MQIEHENLGTSGLQTAAAGCALGPATESLLDALISGKGVTNDPQPAVADRLREFHRADSTAAQLRIWCGDIPVTTDQLRVMRRTLTRDIARIDQLLSDQINEILHTPEFQGLESAWRGLEYLVETQLRLKEDHGFDKQPGQISLRFLSVSKRELKRDFEKASEFEQNSLFDKVYEQEFGMPGGTPYGVLLADYEFTNHPDDLDLLENLAGVGAAAFAPVLAAASPELLSLNDFSKLGSPIDLGKIFEQPRHRRWKSLRQRPDTQFLGLTLPRILMREPYRDDGSGRFGFRFHEDVQGSEKSKYLWGSAAWAMGGVLLRAFADCGWFADIRGVVRGEDGGGLVRGLPTESFHTDASGVANRSSVEVCLSDQQEAELCDLGFIPLSHCKDTPYCVFYSNQSVHQPQQYNTELATANARVSAMLQYVLCCSRMAHYVKVKTRDEIGSQLSAVEVENKIQSWLMDYMTPDDKASADAKARFPLREAEIEVTEILDQPGKYQMILRMLPHYQLDQLSSSMTLVSRRMEFKSKA